MTAALAVGGWAAALGAFAVAAAWRASAARRLALVAQAAHELRGPLGAALLGLHGVVADAAGRRRVAAVELELRRAGLALADLDAAPQGRLSPERAEAVDAWRPLARAFATDLVIDDRAARVLVRADRLRLTQAVGNLVLNALEHGAGPVRIRVHSSGGRVRIEVRDHGPGLPAPIAALTGDALHAARRGHGLAIAARAVHRHGGRLVTAPVSSGACVALELPRADTPERARS